MSLNVEGDRTFGKDKEDIYVLSIRSEKTGTHDVLIEAFIIELKY